MNRMESCQSEVISKTYNVKSDQVKVTTSIGDFLIEFEFLFRKHHEELHPVEPYVGFVVRDFKKGVGGDILKVCCPHDTTYEEAVEVLVGFFDSFKITRGSVRALSRYAFEAAKTYRKEYSIRSTIELGDCRTKLSFTYRDKEVEDLIEKYSKMDPLPKSLGWFIFNEIHPIIDIKCPSLETRIWGEKQTNWFSIVRSLVRYLDEPTFTDWKKYIVQEIVNKHSQTYLPTATALILKKLNATEEQIVTITKDFEKMLKMFNK